MDPEQLEIVRTTEVNVTGRMYGVEIFARANGKCFALTRYTPDDIIITDGKNQEDAFMRHNVVLPLAIGCRLSTMPTVGQETSH